MKIIKVQYTAKEDFVETNKQNISNVMKELKALANPDVKYTVLLLEDGKTFIHIAMFANDGENPIANLDAFKKFREGLNGRIEAPPKSETAELVGSSHDIF